MPKYQSCYAPNADVNTHGSGNIDSSYRHCYIHNLVQKNTVSKLRNVPYILNQILFGRFSYFTQVFHI